MHPEKSEASADQRFVGKRDGDVGHEKVKAAKVNNT
jgi:hypothetical protein